MTTPGTLLLPAETASVREFAVQYLSYGWSISPQEPGENLPVIIREPDGSPQRWRHRLNSDGTPIPGQASCPTGECKQGDFPGHIRRFRWRQYQTVRATLADVDDWLKRWPHMNLGLVTGAISGIVAVDIDQRKDGKANLEAAAGKWGLQVPATLMSRTPGGFHALYRQPAGITTRNGVDFKGGIVGVDIRGDGGLLTIPPSQRPDGAYRWLRRVEPTDAPDWVLRPELVTARIDRTATARATLAGDHPGWVSDLLTGGARSGQRNQEATRLAGYFLGKGLPDDVVTAVLTAFGQRCDPPMDETELAATVRSVVAAEKRARLSGVGEPVPVEIDLGSGWRYEFPDHPIQMTFRDVDRHGDGVHSELTVTHTLRGPDRPAYLLGPVSFNLLAASTQASHAKILRQKLEIEWLEKLQVASRLCLAAWRSGEPSSMLGIDEVEAEVAFALHQFILAEGPSMIFADSGIGKSLIALAVALSIALGEDVGLGFQPKIRRRVGYLDTEWTKKDHDRRVFQLVGRRPGGVNILYKSLHVPIWDAASHLAEWVRDEGIGYLIIDSVAIACGGTPEDSGATNKFFAALRRIGVGGSTGMGALLLAHITNEMARQREPDRPFGSAYWRANVRALWFMTKVQDYASRALDVALICKKVNAGPLYPTLSYHVNFDTSRGIALQRQDVRESAGLADHAPLLERMEYHLRSGPLTLHRIRDIFRSEAQEQGEGAKAPSEDTVRRTAERGVDKGRLARVQSSEPGGVVRYALAYPAPAGRDGDGMVHRTYDESPPPMFADGGDQSGDIANAPF